MMVSIKRLLNAGWDTPHKVPDMVPGASAEQLLRAIVLLLEAIALHAVNWDLDELETFQEALRKLQKDLTEASGGADPLVLAAEIITTVKAYNQGAEKFIADLAAELQSIIKAMTDTLLRVHRSSEAASGNLRGVQRELEQTTQLEDLRTIKTRLVTSLAALGEEAGRQQRQSAEILSQMRKTLAQSVFKSAEHEPRIDPVTLLPSRREALDVMGRILAARKPSFLGLFRLERLDLINDKFGFGAGDQVLRLFAQHVGKRLGEDGRLYRWRGPVFVAILDLKVDLHVVSTLVSSIASAKLEKEVDIGNRRILLPLAAAWTVIGLANVDDVEEVSEKIDSFLFGQAPRFIDPKPRATTL